MQSHNKTYFEQKYIALIEKGYGNDEASLEVIDAYLAGKPIRSKQQKKLTRLTYSGHLNLSGIAALIF